MSALVFWFTGLSGAGKSTVANAVAERLGSQGYKVLILDGDYVRQHVHVDLGFSRADIIKNNALIAQLCLKHRKEYSVIFVPLISPYRESRCNARGLLSPDFYEVYFSAGLDTVMGRDVKGLYAKARCNEISNMIGFSAGSIYEPPGHPDHVIDSGREDEQVSVRGFEAYVIDQLKSKRDR